MEKWFYSLDSLSQTILLVIPFVGYLIEIGVRLFALIRKYSKKNAIGFIVFLVLGWTLLLNIIDAIYLSKKDELMITE